MPSDADPAPTRADRAELPCSAAHTDADPSRGVLRADAERNRQRLIAAALEIFAERGLHVPMEDIARRAGVGVATLYRRFPSRSDLIAGAFEAKMAGYADAAAQALAESDPWGGFCRYVERVCAMQAEDRGFATVLTMTFPADKKFEAERERAYRGFLELAGRAKAAGMLRDDFVAEDLAMLLMGNAGVIAGTAGAAPGTWRRYAAYMIQAFSAEGARPLPPPPSPTAMYRALVRLYETAIKDERCCD
jgi:AcrR family transcriptional regulator